MAKECANEEANTNKLESKGRGVKYLFFFVKVQEIFKCYQLITEFSKTAGIFFFA